MTTNWVEITCDVPAEYADTLADYLAELSESGVSIENERVDAFSLDEIAHAPVAGVKAYFPADADVEGIVGRIHEYLKRLSAETSGFTVSRPAVSRVKQEDWSSSWKENFKPLRVGRRLLIVPSWEEAPVRPDDIVLRIDPGMAFGTGGHETTRLCLELLEQIMDESPTFTTPSVLDLGTGSGILAMAAVKLGAGRVCAADIDPDAVRVARENLAANQLLDQVECTTTPLEQIAGRFNVILANILAEELVRLSGTLAERLEPGGALVLSGILAEKEPLVARGFAATGLAHRESRRSGEWVAMVYVRGADT